MTRITRLNSVTTKAALEQAIATIPTSGGGGGGSGVAAVIAKLRAGLAIRNDACCPIVFCGSSTTEGQISGSTPKRFVNRFIQRLQDSYPLDTGSHPATLTDVPGSLPSAGIQGINLGLGSTTSSGYITLTSSSSPDRFADHIGALNPIVVFHQGDGTDFANGTNPATTKTNILARIAAINAAASRPVLHILWHSYGRWDSLTHSYPWANYLAVLNEIAAADANHVAVLDFVEDFSQVGIGIDSDRSNYLAMMADVSVHMNGKGHAYLADLMFTRLGFGASSGATPIGDTTPPTVGTLSPGTITSSSIQWTWTPGTDDTGVAGYRLFDSTTNVQVGTDTASGATSKTETPITASTTKSRYLKSFDGSGNESVASNTASATTLAGGAGYRAATDPGLIVDVNPAGLALSDGAAVDSVPIGSGSEAGNALAQATTAAKPTFKAVAINGLPALVFDGGDQVATSTWVSTYGPGAADPTPVTLFAVVKATAGDFCNGITSASFLAARKTATTTLNVYSGGTATFSKTDTTAYEVVCVVYKAGTNSTKVLVNQSTGGTTGTTISGSPPSTSKLSGLRIGASSTGSANKLTGEVARLILIKGEVASADITTEMLALGTDYGITVT